ncbi:MAG: hypothetical protein ACFFCW_43885 [Candidatus Hodarchaeota archaeon]
MRKQIITLTPTLLLLLFAANYAFAEATFKFGFNASGDHEVSGLGVTGSEDVEDSISISFEGVAAINDNVGIGGGFTWQIPRSQERYPGDFYFIPFYGLMKIRSASAELAPYLIGQIGYNFIYEGDTHHKGTGIYAATLDGDLYYGVGGGIILNNRLQIEVLYSLTMERVKS